ncbi:MAG TPA: methionyl-tRNA formyltransferase [Bacteroidales bacterium]|nr:methionyl-tRNA formyltransferase [Bacteroidales bacterium]
MNAKEMNIIYMGTPAFAVEPLRVLVKNNYNISAVVTSTDKPAGRGCKIKFSEVKEFALENNIPILQPSNLKDNNVVNQLKNFKPDIFIVVAFRMLPENVWKLPKHGTFNLHASLLPDYRGAAPINHAIINGEKTTGLTTFFIDKEIDTGKIIFQEEVSIEDHDNAGSLHDKLMIKGSDLIIKTIQAISTGTVKTVSQNKMLKSEIKLAAKLTKEFCKIDLNQSCVKVHNFIRGLSPYPAAWCLLNGIADNMKIFKSNYKIDKHEHKTGKIISDNKNYIKIAVSDGYIFLEELQIAGKKRMTTREFLNGYHFSENAYCS